MTRDEIAIATGTGEQRVTPPTAREIAVRRPPHRTGVLIGAGIGSVAGALAACVPSDRSECADGPILLGAVGAGVGLVLSALIPRVTPVYRDEGVTTPGREPAWKPGDLDALALRVDLGDWIRVEDQSGTRVSGRLTDLTGEAMTIESDAGPRRFTAASVRNVSVRGYRLRLGALIGAGALTALALPACRSNSDCKPLAAAPFGAGIGLAVAALIPRMTVVYPAESRALTWGPAVTRRGMGIRVNVRW
jgi:hypothetical protein